ncbi:Na/Pi cotransporter family protein [Lawsonibacter sp. OA9]|uniref:Na/Pi cotransporter family protein n=1 Tax=Oscillospiraceae TaxID=216572 RepID=UPI001F062857|nr:MULTISPECIES: Na/Pi cotransporter family protein [Oscillospiraceae]MCH1978201.1 Na/Pi cotransporter family protein [Lawsonibacter sp. OA9]MCH1983842.1 Na/Pi cotransporter family protein [Ruminococcus sp. OA3]
MKEVLMLAGGLGFFLYGMKMMSEGLEKAAGSKLRKILEVFTKNRFIGVIVGIIFTAIIQSSNATTVMVVSFVNSGLMNLAQASGVIMGASIGTTMTGQLIAFNLSDIAPLFVILGVVMLMFIKKPIVNKFGEVFLGFGMLFMGLSTMSAALAIIKDAPVIVNTLGSLSNPYLAILVGYLVTAVLQSNSATVGILMLLAQGGLLELPICLYLMMGSNIGCTTSALLASLGGRKDARRTALIHLFYNLTGMLIFCVVFLFALNPVVDWVLHISGGNISRAIANANTIMKIAWVVIIFPIMPWIIKLTHVVVRGKDEEGEDFELLYIGDKSMFSPTTAVLEATRELEHMGNMAMTNLVRSMNALITLDEKEIQTVYRVEKNIDYLNNAITNYLVNINQMTLPIDDARSIGGLFHVANDIERIGDHAENIAEAALMVRDDQVTFSSESKRELSEMLDLVMQIMTYALDMFSNNSQEHLQEILDLENRIDVKERDLQQSHVERLTRNACTPEAGMIFSDVVSGLERVADHATNIAFSILDEEPEEDKRVVQVPI